MRNHFYNYPTSKGRSGNRFIRFLFFVCALVSTSMSMGQTWTKGYDFGTSSSSENALAVCSDASNNFYFAGRFCQTVDFDPGAGTTSLSTEVGASTATQNTFLTKYNSSGDYVWAVQIGKSQSNVNVAFNGMATDGTYIYVAGIINDTATFSGTTLYTNNSDIYVAKYSCATGALQWVKQLGGTNADNVAALCIDGSGGVYIQGNYNTSTTMGSTTITVTGGGSAADLFWAKLNASDGSVSWLVGGGGTGTDGSGGIGALAYAPSTGKLVSGAVYNGATGVFGSYSLTNTGLNDVAILELNPATGAFTSATNYGTAGNEFIFGATYDPSTGDVFFAGNYENTVTLPGAGAMSASGTSTSSLLATRYSTSAHTFVWGKAGNMLTGSGTGVNNAFRCVTATGNGAVIYGGSFNGNSSVTLTLSGTTVLAGSGNVDIVMARYAADDGKIEYAYTTGGTGGSEVIFGLSANSGGLVGVAGQNSSTISLGSISLSTVATLDILIAFQAMGNVTTTAPSSITGTSATMGGRVSNSGGASVTDRGVVYSTSTYPTTASTKVSIGTDTGTFSQNVTGLSATTTYYVRSFMTNSYGTFYGLQDTFATLSGSNTAPTFTGGSPQTLSVCQNASATSLNTLLKVDDPDAGQTMTWSVSSAASHGTLSISYSTTSTGSTLTPTGLTYTPTSGYSGSDAFTIQISDGVATATTTINVTVNALPTAYSVTGGGTACSGGSGVAIGLSNSETGVNYQLYLGASTVGSPVAGTGSAISFGSSFTTAGTYTVVATNATSSCTANMTGSAVVVAGSAPTAYSVTGGGAYCSGGSGVAVGLANSQTGKRYQLYVGASTSGSPVLGTGSSITFGNKTTGGTYTVVATDTSSLCTTTMTGSVTVTVNALPTITLGTSPTVTSGATSANLPYSATTGSPTTYSITWSATALGAGFTNISASPGATLTSSPIVLTVPAAAPTNTYVAAIRVNNGTCQSSSSIFTVTVATSNAAPTFTGGSPQTLTVCQDASATAINSLLSVLDSNTGQTLTWSVTSAASHGTVSAAYTTTSTGAAVTPTGLTYTPTAGYSGSDAFTVQVSDGIATASTTINVTVNASATAYNITGGGAICSGGGVAIGISGSQTGVNYQLYRGVTAVGPAAPGTGSGFNFGSFNTAGTYTIIATNTTTSCTANMTGSTTVTVNARPTAYSVTGGGSYCSGGSGVAVGLANSQTGVRYQLYVGASTSGSPVLGTGSSITFGNKTAAGTYTVVATDTTSLCTNNMTGSVTVTVNALPTITLGTSPTVTAGSTSANLPYSATTGSPTTYSITWSATALGAGFTNISASPGATLTSSPIALVVPAAAPVNTYVAAIRVNNGTCQSSSSIFTVTVDVANIAPAFTGGSPQTLTLCQDAGATAINSLLSVIDSDAAQTLTWSVTSAASHGTVAAAYSTTSTGSTVTPTGLTYTPTAGYSGSDAFTVQVSDGTATASTTINVTVNPTPTVTATTDQTLCNGASTTAVSFTGGVSGSTYSWTNSNTSIGLAASGTGDIAAFTATNTGTTAATANIIVTPSKSGCTGAKDTFTITVNPTPTVTATTDQTLCNGAATTAVNFTGAVASTTYSWTNSNTSIGLAASGTGNISSFTATNSGTTPATATIIVTPSKSSCTGTPDTFTITVNPTPTVVATTDQTLCNGAATTAVNFTGAVASTTYSWTNSNTSIGLAASGTGNISSFTATNSGTTPATATIIVTPSKSSCTGTPDTFTITVNPTPTVVATTDQTLCNGAATTAVNFTGAVASTTYSWTNSNTSIGLAASGTGNISSFTATNSGTTPATATIIVTPSKSSCTGTPDTFTITVNPTPTVVATTDQTLCNGAATTAVNFTGAVASTTYSWTNSNTSIGLAASGTGNISSFTATNSGTTPVTATIIVTPSKSSCTGTPDTFTITVNPTPTVTATTDQTICNNGTTTAVSFTGAVASTTYNWTNSNTSIGLAASGTGNIASFTGTNSGSSAAVATIIVTPTKNSCNGNKDTFTITVNPTPSVTPITDKSICVNTITLPITIGGSSVSGTTYNWTNSNPAIGLAASGTGDIPSYTASNGTSAPISGTIIVTPSASSCPGASDTFIITINPIPDVVDPSDQTLCNGATTTAVTFSGSISGTTYAWTNSNTAIGLAASGSGNIAAFTATNTTAAQISGNIIVTPSANGCTGPSQNFTVKVSPTPNVVATTDQTLCNGAATTAVNFTGAVSGTTYSWTNSNTSVGLAASGTGDIASFTATNTGATQAVATIIVSPSAASCTGASDTFVINVNPTPAVDSITNKAYCVNTVTLPTSITGPVSGTTYSWTNSNTAIGLAASGTGNIPSFTASNGTSAPISATITVTPSASGCSGSSRTFTITVNPIPDVVDPTDQTLCNGAMTTAVNFTGAVSGTTYSWTNNNTSIGLAASGTGDIAAFTATNSGTTQATATVIVTPSANGCTGTSQNFTIKVNPTPTVAATTDQTLCNGAATTAVNFTGAVSGTTFNWTNNTTSIGLAASGSGNISSFTATNTGSAPVTATIVVTPVASSCSGATDTFTITVNPTPTVAATTDQSICKGAATTAVNFTGAVSGTTYSWTNSNTSIGLAASGTGNIASFTGTNTTNAPISGTVIVTPSANGCTGTPDTFVVTVNPIPNVDATTDQVLCNSQMTTAVNFTGLVSGTTYSWSNTATSIGLAASGTGNIASFAATNTGAVPVTATIIVTPSANGCTGATDTFTIKVSPTPNVAATSDQTLCNGAVTAAVNFSGTVTGTTYSWTNSATSIGLAASGTGNIAAFVSTNTSNAPVFANVIVTPSANGCVGTPDTFVIRVNPTPSVVATTDQVVCNTAATTAVTFSGAVSGTAFNWVNDKTSIGLAANGIGDIASFTATNSGSAPVTATIVVIPSANGCTGPADTFTIKVNPTPDVVASSDQTLCNNAATTAVNFTGAVSGTTYNWTNSNASIGLAASGTGNIASFTATNTGTTPSVASIIVTPTANSCTGASDTFTVTVNPTPTVVASGDQTLCNGAATTAVNFTGAVSGTTYSWTNSNTSIGLAATGTGNIATFTAVNTGTAPVTATVIVTPTANSCAGASDTFTITVNPTPNIVASSDQIVCNNAATAAVNFSGAVSGTTFSWTNNTTSIGLAASGTGNIASFTATNSGTTPVTATIIVTTSANSCPGASDTFTVKVNPTPTVDSVANRAVCVNTITLPVNFGGSVSGTAYTWTNSNTAIGLAASGTGDIAPFIASNGTSAPIVATITVTPSANGCTGNSRTFTITVNPIPFLARPSSQTLCNGAATAAVNFIGSVAGSSYSWVNTDTSIGLAATGSGNIPSFTARNNGTAPVTANIFVTPSANGCTGPSQDFTITVNPTPNVVASSDQTLCNQAATTAVSFSGAVSGTTYSWTNNTTSIGLAASGTGNIASFTANNSGSAPVTATIIVTPSANSCSGPSDTFMVTVNPTPHVVASSDQTLCNMATTTAVSFSGPVSGTTYSWTNSAASIGLVASGTGDIAAFTATNSGTAPVTASIIVTPSANGCTGPKDTFTITVNPTPNVVASGDQTVCNDASTTAVTFSGAVSGTTYSWTNDNSSIGLATSGSGDIAAFTATNASSAPVTATVIVTPSANGCSGPTDTFTVTVNPTPGVIATDNQTICNNGTTTAVTFTGAVSGTTYSWTNDNSSIGLAASGSGDIAAFTATNSGTTPVTSTIIVTPSANGCTGPNDTFTITVNPTPNVVASSDQTVCNNTSTTAVTFSGAVSGTTYNWTNDNTSIGLAASGSGDIAAFTATNTGSVPATAMIIVTPTANSCPGSSDTFMINVNPTPNVVASGDQAVCNNASTAAVTFSGSVAGTTYSWTNNTTSIGLAASGTGDIAAFTATNSGTDPVIATIVVTPSASGCIGADDTFMITVNPTPVLTSTLTPAAICDSTLFSYTPTSLTSGTAFAWSRAAVTGIANSAATGTDDPSERLDNTTPNPVDVTYVYTLTANGCTNTQNVTVTVNPTPVLSSTLTPAAVCDSALFSYTPTSLTTGTTFAWSRAAVAGIANTAATGTGNPGERLDNTTTAPVNVTYVYTLTANGCTKVQNVTVTVNPTPVLSSTLTPAAICDSTLFSYTPTSLTTGTTFAWSRAAVTGIANTAATGTGNPNERLDNTTTTPVTVTYVYTLTANGCSNTQNVTVTVNPTPTVNVVSNQTVCNGATTTAVTFGGTVAGTTYTWTNSTPSIGLTSTGSGNIAAFTATNLLSTPVTATITITPTANGCSGRTRTFTITVNPTPTVNSVASQTRCNGTSTAAITFTGSVSGTTYAWTNTLPSIGLAGVGTGNIASFVASNTTANPVVATITVTPSASGCTGSSRSFTITVNPTPVLSSALTPGAVCNSTTFNYTPTSATTGTTFNWSRAAVTGISNPAATGVGDPNETLVNTTTDPVNVTYVYTLSANGCTNNQNVVVTVNPTPVLTSTTTPAAICDSAVFSYTPSSATTGTTFAWTRAAVTGISNAAGSGAGDPLEALDNTTTDPVDVTYMYTLTANGCSNTQSVVVTVNPTPMLNSTLTPSAICDSAVFSYSPTSLTSGTTFAWTRAAVTGISNPAASGTGDPAEQLVNTTSGQVTVVYAYTLTANGCSHTQNVSVVVNPTSRLTSIPTAAICSQAPFTYVPTASVTGTTFDWTRDAVAGISNPAAAGTGSVNETLVNTTLAPVDVTYTYTLTAFGCSESYKVTVTVQPKPADPMITIAPSPDLCDGTMYQNFGALSPEPAGVTYSWTAINADVWAKGSTRQFAVVNFTNPGTSMVILTANVPGFSCISADTFIANVGTSMAASPTVVYFSDHFVCLDNTMDSYQWGYDEVRTLDSAKFNGEKYQDYVNASPDFLNKYYWVITTKGGCSQKSYYNAPTGVGTVNKGNSVSVTVFPNPAQENIEIAVDGIKSGELTVEIMDMNGKVFKSMPIRNTRGEMLVGDLPSGFYSVVIYHNGARISATRLVKN